MTSYNATISPALSSHTDHISLRFRTLNRDGMLLKTSNRFTRDSLSVALQDGRGKLDVDLNGQTRVSN